MGSEGVLSKLLPLELAPHGVTARLGARSCSPRPRVALGRAECGSGGELAPCPAGWIGGPVQDG